MWDLAMRCQTQLRISDLNGIVGFDRAIFFQTAEVLGYDVDAIVVLINFVEQGMLEKISEIKSGNFGRAEHGMQLDNENFGVSESEVHG